MLRRDPVAGRWVAIAPARATRPGASGDHETCPFCAGHEERTPPETLRLGDGPKGWGARVVPNLYPALERQEVVVHSPEHITSFGALGDPAIDLVAEAWQRRARDAGGTVFAFINEGQQAGASLPHSHSQLAWLPTPPPVVVAERGLPEIAVVVERDGLVAGCPLASRVPYEIQIAPVSFEPDALRSDLLAAGLRLLADMMRRIQSLHPAGLDFNAWLHDGMQWHIELLPRTTPLAGLELGAGVWINPVAPEDAAKALRALA